MVEQTPPPGTVASGTVTATRVVAQAEPASVRLIIALNRAIYRLARHWLLAANSLFGLWASTIVLAPFFAAHGHGGLAHPLYAFNGLFCHQRPDRSFFLWGHQLACCQRCTAIYGSLFLFGLFFIPLRGRLRRPSWLLIGLLSLPLVLDGLTQLAGLRESSPALRVLTGMLVALAISSILLPYLEAGFADMRTRIELRFARLVAAGRARPL
jgi:uncharacterized membrane protein